MDPNPAGQGSRRFRVFHCGGELQTAANAPAGMIALGAMRMRKFVLPFFLLMSSELAGGDPDRAMAITAQLQMYRTYNYIKRGRRFKRMTIAKLSKRWIVTTEKLALSPLDGHCNEENADLSAEFELRKIEPPYELIKHSMKCMLDESDRHYATLKADSKFMAYLRSRFTALADLLDRRGEAARISLVS